MLVLLPWYLNKLHLEVVNLIIHLLKVLLHPFDLAFIVPIDLAGYNLRIAVHNHIIAPVTLERSSLATKASYSASLFVVGKSRRIMHSTLSPFRL